MLYNTRKLYTPPLEPYEYTADALLLDTETIGTGAQTEVIEVAVGNTQGEIIFQSLVQPIFNPLPNQSRLPRFDAAELRAAPIWETVAAELFPLLNRRVVVAYNAVFDRRALAAMCNRAGQQSPERAWRCAMLFVKNILSVKKSLSLTEACAHFGVAGGTHRAADDVLATHRLLKQALK